MPYYFKDPRFKLMARYMLLPDRDLVSFIRQEQFSPNEPWSRDNPVLHCWLANEYFVEVRRLLQLVPKRINPNLCDGLVYGKKSLLIILALLTSNGTLPLEFIERYSDKIKFNYQDLHGKTAMHYAVILGRLDLLKALIEHGASTDIQDENLLTPFDYLNCPIKLITETLKSIDIDPRRDVML